MSRKNCLKQHLECTVQSQTFLMFDNELKQHQNGNKLTQVYGNSNHFSLWVKQPILIHSHCSVRLECVSSQSYLRCYHSEHVSHISLDCYFSQNYKQGRSEMLFMLLYWKHASKIIVVFELLKCQVSTCC